MHRRFLSSIFTGLRHTLAIVLSFSALGLAGCSGGGDDEATPATAQATGAPIISGTPQTSVRAGSAYAFQPTASAPGSGTLTFAIQNRPVWATFSTATGRLSGTPSASHVGSYPGIVITASDGLRATSLPPFGIAVTSASSGGNSPPSISGAPSTQAISGLPYVFQPTASDPDGNALTFAIQNRPPWATFSSANGTLSGTPNAADGGTYSNILISVTDSNQASATLPAFSIQVVQQGGGTAVVSWTAPATNTDGSSLTDLLDYRIYYGTSASQLSPGMTVPAGTLTAQITGLNSGTYYFAVTARNSAQIESDLSNIVSKLVM